MRTFEGMSARRLEALVAGFPRLRVAVIGDFFLDKYLDVEPAWAEPSLETGKIAHQVARMRRSPGAAGTVVSNLSALGAGTLHAIGFTGDDGESYELRKGLEALGCRTEHMAYDPERSTPTYLKPRDLNDMSLAGEHNRYDTKNRTATSQALEDRLLASLDARIGELDAVIVADQVDERDCGVVTRFIAEALADRARRHPGVIFFADSRRRIRELKGLIIKPNQFEAVDWAAAPPDAKVDLPRLEEAVLALRAQTGAAVFVTRGAEGILVSDPEPTLVGGVRVEGPVDPTGAGDSVTAGTVLALAAGATHAEAALVGNLVASITVEQLATTGTARPDQLPPRLALWTQQRS